MIKTITFALMHFSIAFTVVYLMTGSLTLGGLVAVIEPLVNTVGYFFHEKLWERIQRSRSPASERPAAGPIAARHSHWRMAA